MRRSSTSRASTSSRLASTLALAWPQNQNQSATFTPRYWHWKNQQSQVKEAQKGTGTSGININTDEDRNKQSTSGQSTEASAWHCLFIFAQISCSKGRNLQFQAVLASSLELCSLVILRVSDISGILQGSSVGLMETPPHPAAPRAHAAAPPA